MVHVTTNGDACNFAGKQKRQEVAAFLKENGDSLPAEAIKEATSKKMIDNWSLLCNDRGEIVSGVTYMYNDWYLCTVHYLATKASDRGKGHGSKVTAGVIEKMMNDDRCLVLAADITFDNAPSKRIFEKNGFKPVDRFCWKKGEKPADIVHYVKMPTKGSASCKTGFE